MILTIASVAPLIEVSSKDYLISQAKVFYKSKEFQQAVNIAQYILNNIDKEFQPAKDLAEEAKAKIQETLDNQIDKIKF